MPCHLLHLTSPMYVYYYQMPNWNLKERTRYLIVQISPLITFNWNATASLIFFSIFQHTFIHLSFIYWLSCLIQALLLLTNWLGCHPLFALVFSISPVCLDHGCQLPKLILISILGFPLYTSSLIRNAGAFWYFFF